MAEMSLSDTLMAFGEWIDSKDEEGYGLVAPGDFTYEQIGQQFIEWWQSDPDRVGLPGVPAVPNGILPEAPRVDAHTCVIGKCEPGHTISGPSF